MTGRRIRLIGAALALIGLSVWAARVDVPALEGPIKGDEASYIAMALSVAKDGDLKYRPEDYRRFVELYRSGPNGIFLKQSFDLKLHAQAAWPPVVAQKVPVSPDVELDFGKPFAYAVAAAPFAAVFGPGGLLLFNVLLFAACLWCAILFCQARAGRVAGTVIAVAFMGASILPVYLVWQTSEMFNVSLVLIAYFLWLYKEVAPPTAPGWLRDSRVDWLALALLGVAAFSKLPNAPLAAAPVLLAWWRRQWLRGLALGLLFSAVTLGLFGANAVISGDWNFQGGNRNYFSTTFPFDERGTRFEVGHSMTTNEANDEGILSPSFLFPTLRLNVVYFLVGRDSGFLPYFFPGAIVALLWLTRLRRARPWEWFVAGSCVLGILVTLISAPLLWNGGGGPVGNRYFLSIYPTLLFLVPAGAGILSGLAALAGGLFLVGWIFLHPFTLSRSVWLIPEHWPIRLLPVESPLINNLPVFLADPPRAHLLVSENPEVFLYYMDSNTYSREKDGFWVRGNATADIVVRTGRPLTRLELKISAPIANEVDVSLGSRRAPHMSLKPGDEKTAVLRPEPGVHTQGYQILLRITTTAGFYPRDTNPASTDARYLGVFIKPSYEAP